MNKSTILGKTVLHDLESKQIIISLEEDKEGYYTAYVVKDSELIYTSTPSKNKQNSYELFIELQKRYLN